MRPSSRSSRSGCKWLVAVGLLAIYAWYVKGHFAAEAGDDSEELAPLRFHRLDRGAHRREPAVPRLRIVNVQVIVALACIIAGRDLLRGCR